jgi:hypothetical protein
MLAAQPEVAAGKAPVGTGGVTLAGGSGGGGGSGGAGGSSVVDFGPYTVHEDGYVTSGPWHGWAWTTSPDGTISPQSFDGAAAGTRLCAAGTVGRDSHAYAILGIDVAQSPENGNEPHWIPTGPGLFYDITNVAGSPLRLQIAAEGGVWCAPISGGHGQLDWGQLNTKCWDGSGTPYDGRAPMVNVMVLVPGSETETVAFDFCINSLGPR